MESNIKKISIWDLVLIQIQSLYLPLMVAILGGKFMIFVSAKPHLFSTQVYKVPLIHLLAAMLIVVSLFLYLNKLWNNPQSTDLKYSFEKALKFFYDSYSSLDPSKNKKTKLKASLIKMLYFINIYIFFVPYYLFSSSSLPVILTIVVQLLQIIFMVFFMHRSTMLLLQKGLKGILEEQFDSSVSQNYPSYSRLRLYSLNLITFICL